MNRFIRTAILTVFTVMMITSVSFAGVDYGPWEKVLSKYVNDGWVNYKALKNDRVELDQFVLQVSRTDISVLKENEVKAFWINAYNALTLKAIIDKYPVKSIRRIWRVWDVSRDVAQGQYSLGDIEHKILRPMGDPRIHFALNCASIGCPKLPNKPFYPETLNEQLNMETAKFVNDPEKVRFDSRKNILYVSSIFKWFKKDFLEVSPDILRFVKKYTHPEKRAVLTRGDVEVRYLGYDWDLNDTK